MINDPSGIDAKPINAQIRGGFGDATTRDWINTDPGGSSALMRIRTTSVSQHLPPPSDTVPTVFKWDGGGKEVYLSGSFTHWSGKIPLAKSEHDFYTIVELAEGQHEYKFLVDGTWKHDPKQKHVDNTCGSMNNVITIEKSDFEVFEALAVDSTTSQPSDSGSSATTTGGSSSTSKPRPASPPGSYTQIIPPRTRSGSHERIVSPPVLPPHLLQVILNKDIPVDNEPTLLPEPNHVMLNHLYALSIKDGVMVLSATHRYRKKYVTTLLYKPI